MRFIDAFFTASFVVVTLAACANASAPAEPVASHGDAGTGADAGHDDGGLLDSGGGDASSSIQPARDASTPDSTAPNATCSAPIGAVDTSRSTNVVGSGAASGCTEIALATALTKGGIVTFDCGSADVTITLSKTLVLPTDRDTVIDGGGKVTIDGGGSVRILSFSHADFRKNDHALTLQHLTLAHGKASGTTQYPQHAAPCSSGFYDGAGGALAMSDGVLYVVDVRFLGNQAANVGPDVGGGALYISGSKKGVIVGATFVDNTASNGGAIGLLNSDLDVYDSTFENNHASGFGANGDDATKCSYLDPVTNQHQTGSGGNGGAIAIDGGADGTHTFCGVIMKGNKGGTGALGGAIFRTPDGSKQTTSIDRSLFDGNTGDSGGALYFHNSDLTVTASTFSNNHAATSGAIQADGTTFTFTNTTFAANQSTGVGGTLSLFGGGGTLTNCTFSGNSATAFAAAIFGSPDLTIVNSIFANDTAGGAPMQCQSGSGMAGSNNFQWPQNDAACVPGIAFTDPKLGALGDHGGAVPTMLPAAGSVVIGAGHGCPSTDARGKARPSSGCTAGAVEGAL